VPSTNPYDRLTDADAALSARNEHGGVSAKAVWDIDPDNTLTSITAWRYWDWSPANDRDYTGLAVYTKVNNPTKQNQYTQEFRFNHKGKGYDFVVGLFGFHQDIRTSGIQQTGPAASKWLLNPTSALSNNPAVLNNLVAINDIRLNNTSLAAYAKLNWDITDSFTVSPGFRVNYDKKDGSIIPSSRARHRTERGRWSRRFPDRRTTTIRGRRRSAASRRRSSSSPSSAPGTSPTT
jgi:iron complex outermembrane receptor protein